MKEYLTKLETIGKYDHKEWVKVEQLRKKKAENLQLISKDDKPLWFVMDSIIIKLISEIENQRGFLDSLKLPKNYLHNFHKKALNQEAYYSSHIEGAVTSLEEALLNLKSSKSNYVDESMQMIYNNKVALEFILKKNSKPFSHEIIYKLHELLVYNTHKEKPITVGAYRQGMVYVVDGLGRVVYEAPTQEKVMPMMNFFIKWLNEESELHPLIKAAMVHLYFVHIHPFDDGNGRSARALSNLFLEKANYKFINFLAPSDYFDHYRSEYYKSIQDSRVHDYDTTYFIIYYLKALANQLIQVKKEIAKEQKIKTIKDLIKSSVYVQLNKRQIKTLAILLKTEEPITTRKYCKINKCSDETARKDFGQLVQLKILTIVNRGRSTSYLLKI